MQPSFGGTMDSGEFSRLLTYAGLGLASWDDVSAALSATFDEVYVAFNCLAGGSGKLSFLSYSGFSAQSVSECIAYYSAHNPWAPLVDRQPLGVRSGCDAPIEEHARTEFVNDWMWSLHPQCIAVALELTACQGSNVFFACHDGTPHLLKEEQRLADQLMVHVESMHHAVEMDERLADSVGHGVAAAALVARSTEIAFVVDDVHRVIEANAQAEAAFVLSHGVKVVRGKVQFEDRATHVWYQETARALIDDQCFGVARNFMVFRETVFELTMDRVPLYDPYGGNRHIHQRHLILVLVKDVSRSNLDCRVAENLLRKYRLTHAEIGLCQALARGSTLNEAAEELKIGRGTARQRLKAIFSKTGFSRQVELVAMFARMV